MKRNAVLDTVLASTRANAVLTVHYDGACPVFSRQIAALRRQAGVDRRVWIAASSCLESTLGATLSPDRVRARHRLIASGHDSRSRRCTPASHQRCQSSWAWVPRPLTLWRWGRDSRAIRQRSGRLNCDTVQTSGRQILRGHHSALDALTHETIARPMASSASVGQSAFIHRAPRRLVAPARGVANPFASAGPKVLRCISFSNC